MNWAEIIEIIEYLIIGLIYVLIIASFIVTFTPQKLDIKRESSYSELKNGDIIIFGPKSFTDLMIPRFLMRCPATHVGLVYKDYNNTYLFEGTYLEKYDHLTKTLKEGALITPIKEKLDKHKVIVLSLNKELSSNKIRQIIEEINDKKFNRSMISWLRNVYFKNKSTEKMFCSQFVAYLLKRMKVIKGDFEHFSPCTFYMRHFETEEGYRYEKPRIILLK